MLTPYFYLGPAVPPTFFILESPLVRLAERETKATRLCFTY